MSDIFWKKILADFEGKMSHPNFATWLKPTRFVENRGGLIVVAVPNPYAKNWLEKNLLKEFRKICKEEFDDFEDIRFEVSKEIKDLVDDRDLPLLKQATNTAETAQEDISTNSATSFTLIILLKLS